MLDYGARLHSCERQLSHSDSRVRRERRNLLGVRVRQYHGVDAGVDRARLLGPHGRQ